MQLVIINGPNLNLLGKREPEVYGNKNFETYFETLVKKYADVTLHYVQSNVEGELINAIQQYGFTADGIILNAGGYTHTSVAIRDAIAAINTKVIEVHISNIYAREEFRKQNLLAEKVVGSINGLGLQGYNLAIDWFIQNAEEDAA